MAMERRRYKGAHYNIQYAERRLIAGVLRSGETWLLEDDDGHYWHSMLQ